MARQYEDCNEKPDEGGKKDETNGLLAERFFSRYDFGNKGENATREDPVLLAQFRWKLFAALVGLSILLTALTAQWYVWPIYLDQTTSRGLTTLRQSVASMLGMVHQYEKLPELLAQDDLLEQLVQDTDNIYLIDQTNRALYQTNTLLGASDMLIATEI